MDLLALHTACAAVSPHVIGVSAPNPADYTTWVVYWDGAQQASDVSAVQAVMAAYNPATINAGAASVIANMADPATANAITLLKGATPAQINTWVTNNVTNLAQAQTAIGTILKILAALLVN